MTFTELDHRHMAHALRLAERGQFTCKPNPCVGAVLALGADVVGVGWHQRAGEPHAEVFALREAGARAVGATAYVTLEPCAHHGRTPPCSDALLAAGVKRVVYASADPNPLVSGQGIERLRHAGVEVVAGLMSGDADRLIEGFLSRMRRQRPFVRVKSATSLDGRIALASGESKWITGEAARADVHRWRAAAGAILTGIGTVLADNPRLTARVAEPFVPPIRVVLDARGRMPSDAAVIDAEAPTLVICAEAVSDALSRRLSTVQVIGLPVDAAGHLALMPVLTELARRGVNDLFVEAGGQVAGSFLRAGLIDEWLLYQNACVLGDQGLPVFAGVSPSDMANRPRWRVLDHRQFGDDTRQRLRSC